MFVWETVPDGVFETGEEERARPIYKNGLLYFTLRFLRACAVQGITLGEVGC